MPAKAHSGRSPFSANQTTSLVSGFGFGAYFGEAVEGDEASVLGLEPAAPVWRGSVPDIGDRRSVPDIDRDRHAGFYLVVL